MRQVHSFAGVEAVFGSIWDSLFPALACLGGGRATLSLGAAEVNHVRQFTAATPGNGLYQQPGHGGSIFRRSTRDRFALYFASVLEPPCGPGKMSADHLPVLVQEFRVGSFEFPGGDASGGLTDIDLVAFGFETQEQHLIFGGLKSYWGGLRAD